MKYDKLIMKYILVIACVVIGIMNWNAIISFVLNLYRILGPVINGCVIAYILNLLMVRYEKLFFGKAKTAWQVKVKRPVSIALALLTFVVAMVFLVVMVLPQIVSAVSTVIAVVPEASTQLQNWIQSYNHYFPQLEELMKQINFNWGNFFQQVINILNGVSANILSATLATASGVASNIINTILSLMLSLYILGSKEKLTKQMKRVIYAYLKPQHANQLLNVLALLNHSVTNFFVGITIEGVILGSLVAIASSLVGLPYAGMLGVICGVCSLIPILGGYLSATVGSLILLASSPSQALLFLVMVIVIQQLEGNLIYPRVVGGSIGLPGLWVLVSVTVGGGLFGIIGMILGIPLAATLYKLLGRDVRQREEQAIISVSDAS